MNYHLTDEDSALHVLAGEEEPNIKIVSSHRIWAVAKCFIKEIVIEVIKSIYSAKI
jgi:hypothetical protein